MTVADLMNGNGGGSMNTYSTIARLRAPFKGGFTLLKGGVRPGLSSEWEC